MLREALATFKALPAGRSAAKHPRLARPWPAPEVTPTRGDQTAPRGLRHHHQGSRPARPSRRLQPQPPPSWAHRLPDSALLLAAPRRSEEPAQHHLLPAAAALPPLPPRHGDGGPACRPPAAARRASPDATAAWGGAAREEKGTEGPAGALRSAQAPTSALRHWAGPAAGDVPPRCCDLARSEVWLRRSAAWCAC